VALICTVILYVSDQRHSHGHLNMSVKNRLQYNKIMDRRKERAALQKEQAARDLTDSGDLAPLAMNISGDGNADSADSIVRNRGPRGPAVQVCLTDPLLS
jgi:hypothetical protein